MIITLIFDNIYPIVLAYVIFLFLFLSYFYTSRKYLPVPKFNNPVVEDPCVLHKNVEGEDYIAKRDVRSKFKSNAEQNGLKTYTEIPFYLQGNPWIVDGYRSNYTVLQTLKSLFFIHNETANVYSHLLGLVLFFYLMCINIQRIYTQQLVYDYTEITMMIYMIGAQFLFFGSSTFHLLCCTNRSLYGVTARLDYTGIAVLIITSFYPGMKHFFFCNPGWGKFYTFAITFLGTLAICFSWFPVFQVPHYQPLRAGVFIGLGLFAIFPIPHSIYFANFSAIWPMMWQLMVMGGLYIGGALLYVFKIPEKWHPSKFDLIFNSHFIFHVNVVFASIVHYVTCNQLPQWSAAVLAPLCIK